jgi:predicted nucleic acid-binding protein
MSVDQLVDRYADLTSVVRPIAIAGIAPDPDDDVVIGTTIAARAEFIVTGDRDLHSVGQHRGVRIVSVRQVLAEIEQLTK